MTLLTAIPNQRIRVAKGQDLTIEFRIRSHEWVQLTADAAGGATSLSVKPLAYALASGAKLLFGQNYVVTLSSAADAGDVTVVVTATDGPLKAGDYGQMLRDLTGYTIAMEVLANRGDALPVITLSGGDVTLATQSSILRGVVDVALAAADTIDLNKGEYYFSLWKTDSGTKRPLSEGDFEIVEMGQL